MLSKKPTETLQISFCKKNVKRYKYLIYEKFGDAKKNFPLVASQII